jgi:hypothetical protein
MNITNDGLVCSKCGFKISSNLDLINIPRRNEKTFDPIYRGGRKENSLIVKWKCPRCDNPEAYQTITTNIGEHAGVNTDRSITRYKCTRCFHTWIKY